MNIGIVITGIITDQYLNDLINCYKYCNYAKIISTWNYIDERIIDRLKDEHFIIVQSEFPENIFKTSVNFQNYSCLKGIEYAESVGITHVLRMRADMECNDICGLLEIYKRIYETGKLIFLLHYHNNPIGYLIDYAHFGSTNDSKKYICNFQVNGDNRFAEQFRQEMCYLTSDLNIINNYVVYSGKYLLDNGIEFSYTKPEYRHYTNLIKHYNDVNTSVGCYSF
jgi:hypothetical protein